MNNSKKIADKIFYNRKTVVKLVAEYVPDSENYNTQQLASTVVSLLETSPEFTAMFWGHNISNAAVDPVSAVAKAVGDVAGMFTTAISKIGSKEQRQAEISEQTTSTANQVFYQINELEAQQQVQYNIQSYTGIGLFAMSAGMLIFKYR